MKPILVCCWKVSFHLLAFFLSAAAHGERTVQSFTIAGFVKENNGTALPYANVSLQCIGNNNSSHTLADSRGYFRFEGLTEGHYLLIAQTIGHVPAVSDTIVLTESNQNADYTFLMESTSQTLDEVVISSQKPVVEFEKGKMTFCRVATDVEIVEHPPLTYYLFQPARSSTAIIFSFARLVYLCTDHL